VRRPGGGVGRPGDVAILEGSDLRVRDRRGNPLLEGVELSLRRGEIYFLLGPSGAGKSLTLLALAGLLPRDLKFRGRVFFKGKLLSALPPSRRRRLLGKEIGLVLQEPGLALDPALPVGRQVAEPLRVHYGLSRRESLTSAEAALAQEGLRPAGEIGRLYPHMLSGGMRQRVLLAQVFSLVPDVLLLDEAAGALDLLRRADLAWRVRRETEERNVSVLWVSHDLRLARALAGRVGIAALGRIVESGPPRAVMEAPLHPFTAWFLGRAGSLGPPAGRNWDEGCPWREGCPRAGRRCRRKPQPEREAGGREVLCWNPRPR